MIVLHAILESSGRGFIEKDGNYYHIEAPYSFDNFRRVKPTDVAEALVYGFKKHHQTFDNFNEVKAYLIKMADIGSEGITEKLETIFRKMPKALLKFQIEKTQHLLKSGQYILVLNLCEKLMENKNLDEELSKDVQKINDLAKQIHQEKISERLKSIFTNVSYFPGYEADIMYVSTEINSRLIIETEELQFA